MADHEPAAPETGTVRRPPPSTNPFSQPAVSAQVASSAPPAAIASWSSAAASVPFSASRPASFVSDTPQFSRKRARHVPLDQQRTAAAAMRHKAALQLFQYSASSASSSSSASSASSSRLVGASKRKQLGGASNRSTPAGDTPLSKHEAEKGSILQALLSPGQQSVVSAVQAGKSVFFTGCAGTGKSFLLTYLKHSLPSETTYFTASTGLAAVNISGQTLHSFAGVGLGEGDPRDVLQRVQVQQNARRRWQTCEILVVDEVSMIDCGLFDKLEYIARSIRKNPLPFGGIQLILTGDFLQLPPVKKGSGFCFESRSWADCVTVTIELQSVFRQGDSSLVGILNQLRRGVVDRAAAAAMQSCINRRFDTSDGIEATELYAMKSQVSQENDDRLARLDSDEAEYAALDRGSATYLDQLTRSCNAVERLVLKEGAQVMLIKNLTSALVNGSRGVVVGFDVQAADDIQMEHRRVSPDGRWPRVKFTNGSEMTMLPERWDVEVSQKSVASRTQVPLMLAWSLTVHKCQGMTLDRVSLHLGSIFEYGQAYVALSRIRSLDSLSIKDKFPQHVIKAHPKALKFYEDLHKLNGHSANAQPAAQPAPIQPKPATFASHTPADVPDPYDDGEADADMAISDELIAMAASDENEAVASTASHLLPSTFTERDLLLSRASFTSSASTPFVRASTLSLSQPASALHRGTIGPSPTSSTTTSASHSSHSASLEARAQSSVTAATVRRHQLLLKRQAKVEEAHTAAPPSDASAAAPPSSPDASRSGRQDEIDLVSEDDESEPPVAAAASSQQQRAEEPASAIDHPQQQPAPPLGTPLSSAAEKKLSARTRSFVSSSDLHALTQHVAAATAPVPAATVKPEADGTLTAPTISTLPPLQGARCSAHDRPLQASIDWNKENEASANAMNAEGDARKPKRQLSDGAQWLYRCEMGCMFVVKSIK